MLCAGIHLSPEEFHKAMMNENSVMIDVRNFNETLIGKFAPPTAATDAEDASKRLKKKRKASEEPVASAEKVLDPCMV